ncbi:unnamed protein product [Rhizophagus irregularis]|nr:unnamed protein product [Rhizophagus irregularis]
MVNLFTSFFIAEDEFLTFEIRTKIKKDTCHWNNKKKNMSRYQLKYDILIKPFCLEGEKNNELFSVEMCIREIDNTKANLHGILLMIIIVKTLACVKIKTGKLLIDLITDFINEDSSRKKSNHRELEFLGYLIREKSCLIEWEELKKENDEGNNLSAFSDKEVGIKLELMQLDFNIYTLRWNKNIIYGDYRNYLKKFNQIKYKSSILTCHYLENIFYRNEHQEINWKMTFGFLQRGTGNNKRFTDAR